MLLLSALCINNNNASIKLTGRIGFILIMSSFVFGIIISNICRPYILCGSLLVLFHMELCIINKNVFGIAGCLSFDNVLMLFDSK